MKFLLDPVYTNRPRVCSTSYLAWELIEALIEWRDDTFFYLAYPPAKVDEEDMAFLSRHPDRVRLVQVPGCHRDRLSEMHMLRNELRYFLNPWSEVAWDADVVVSSRIPVLKHMALHSLRNNGKGKVQNRLFVGLDEMPLLPFRESVPWSDVMYPDTLVSYLLADAVLINNQWTKSQLKPVLREVLSPAMQREVLARIHEVVPVKLERLQLKQQLYQGGNFEVAFVGRVTNTRNFHAVAELFRKQFSFPLGKNKQKMQFRISSNSISTGAADYGELDFVDMQMNDRPKFHAFLQGAHVALNLSKVEDFSLSTYETLRAGVPLILYDYPWNQFLGPDYPFRVQNEVQAYALINAFAADYSAQYAKFVAWEQSYWRDYVAGPLNVTTAERLIDLVAGFESARRERVAGLGGGFREVLPTLPVVEGRLDLQAHFNEQKLLMPPDLPAEHSDPLSRYPSVLLLKLIAQEMGFRDTLSTGILHKE